MHTLEQLRSGALTGVRRLDLCCSLQTVPPEVWDLADTLEVLNLSGNRLSSLPPELARLHRLKVIFCSDNAFTTLPEVLGACPALEMVGFKANQIDTVPAAALPQALRWLTLTDNAIAELPRALGERPALQKLLLAGNQLRALPATLAQASRLELVRLAANELGSLPGWLPELPRLSWLALAGNPLGWDATDSHGAMTGPRRDMDSNAAPLEAVPWADLAVDALLGEGASGLIYRVHRHGNPVPLALKLFKGALTSDGLPEHELAACLAAGQHPALCTPIATLAGHPQGLRGLLLPLIPPHYTNLAAPPSLDSCTRDVYPSTLQLAAPTALKLAAYMAQALAHLHARGVLHGDVYAHNILWDPASGQALLSDFGAATLLPSGSPSLRRSLQALDVRAFGCLLEELLARVPRQAADGGAVADQTGLAGLAEMAQACLRPEGRDRPTMAELAQHLIRTTGTSSCTDSDSA
jgi:hypothetical protein